MKFYKHLIRSFNDLPGYQTLLIHSLIGCNFQCLGCHNYDELVLKKDLQPYYSSDDIIDQLKKNGYFFDAIIFSGGEFLLENINNIITFLSNVKSVYKGKIIINTNGSFPEKIEQLFNRDLIDGIHIDMKLPYHLLDIDDDKEIYKSILGFIPTNALVERITSSIELVVKHNSPYSQIRTVRYPILSNQFFQKIEQYVIELNKKYNSNISYHINEFLIIK